MNQQQIEKNQAEQADMSKRFGELSEYDVKDTGTVCFVLNSHAAYAEGPQELRALAVKAKRINAWVIRVAGHTDSSGSGTYD